MTVLVTGAAGFIGFHLCHRLIESGVQVIGFDNVNNYYDVKLKRARLSRLYALSNNLGAQFTLVEGNLEDQNAVKNVFSDYQPSKVVNLAAQAGVRFSIENPTSYIQSNIVGFGNILEGCRTHQVEHLVYASSSSVYGGNAALPFSEQISVDHPVNSLCRY